MLETAETETAGRRTRNRYVVRFAFDRLFEYLPAEDILREAAGLESLTGEQLDQLAEQAGHVREVLTGYRSGYPDQARPGELRDDASASEDHDAGA